MSSAVTAVRRDLGSRLFAMVAGPEGPANRTPLRRFDPTCRLRGWRTLAAEVDRMREALRAGGEDPVLACGSWSLPRKLLRRREQSRKKR